MAISEREAQEHSSKLAVKALVPKAAEELGMTDKRGAPTRDGIKLMNGSLALIRLASQTGSDTIRIISAEGVYGAVAAIAICAEGMDKTFDLERVFPKNICGSDIDFGMVTRKIADIRVKLIARGRNLKIMQGSRKEDSDARKIINNATAILVEGLKKKDMTATGFKGAISALEIAMYTELYRGGTGPTADMGLPGFFAETVPVDDFRDMAYDNYKRMCDEFSSEKIQFVDEKPEPNTIEANTNGMRSSLADVIDRMKQEGGG